MNPKLTLLILSVLSASALNVFAANKVVTAGQDVIETDQTYAAVTGYSALTVNGGTYTGTNIALSSTVAGRYGAYIYGQGALTLTGGTVTGNSDAGTVYGVDVINTSVARLENVSIDISGSGNTYGVIATYSSTVSVKGGSITLGGLGGSYGPRGLMALYGAQIHAEDLLVTINGRGTSIISERSGSLITLKNVTVNSLGTGLSVQYNASLIANQVTVTSELTGLRVNRGGTLILNDSLVTMTGENAVAVIAGDSQNNLIVNGGTLAGGAGLLHIDSNADSVNQVTLNNVDTTGVTGDNSINVADTDLSTTTVTINGGTGGLNGDVTNPGSGALTVNLNDSSLTGDIINTGDGTLTIILDNDSVGTGGYHGGNLITGSDSTWTFNKNSHGNYGENHGVWNIGDYKVIFDNMIHTGTVTISVNSDTGEGGSIIITNTADGEGTVHIDTIGNGQLNPNDVLPGIVSGDGTEHWQWDPIDWGIDTIIKDGDHFIKSGVSPAGAVLNSSVAIQQAMWFAQQNSLLKRMGELRYGARASRPLADKDVRVPYHSLIENIWIRSYGQQLNVGSQVAGKAYEQLIYGVDLGTDHKVTISADSDLYLGIYAGYGRSDIDYRTPGADGEINAYYGGFYATWLHSSGFYIDATVKAASVDNDLKAPYSGSQITANYSDINLGGSLEIGKKFTFADAWFIEPQFQVNYLHILAENYTAGPMTISAQDLDALQFRIGSLFGRTIKLTNGGALQPYIKISGVETISSGGTLRNGYQHTRANTDGARAELGAGLIWQLDADNQLHLDYEASFGDKYDKPWGLTAGYRHQF